MSDHGQHFVSLRNAWKPKPSINSSLPGQRRDEGKDRPESWRVFLDRLQQTIQLRRRRRWPSRKGRHAKKPPYGYG